MSFPPNHTVAVIQEMKVGIVMALAIASALRFQNRVFLHRNSVVEVTQVDMNLIGLTYIGGLNAEHINVVFHTTIGNFSFVENDPIHVSIYLEEIMPEHNHWMSLAEWLLLFKTTKNSLYPA